MDTRKALPRAGNRKSAEEAKSNAMPDAHALGKMPFHLTKEHRRVTMENTSEVAHNLTRTDLVAYHVAAYTLTMKRVDIAAT
jgi:hypothetical protein